MNKARLALARAKLHEAIDDMFDAMEEGSADAANDVRADAKSKPRVRQGRRPRRPVVSPNVQVSETDRAAARAALRKAGFVQVKG